VFERLRTYLKKVYEKKKCGYQNHEQRRQEKRNHIMTLNVYEEYMDGELISSKRL